MPKEPIFFNRSIVVGLWLVLLLGSDRSQSEAGPITFNTGLPVAKDQIILREQFVLSRATDDPGSMGRDFRVLALPVVLAYGVTGDLTLFGILPYLEKTLGLTSAAGRQGRMASAWGI